MLMADSKYRIPIPPLPNCLQIKRTGSLHTDISYILIILYIYIYMNFLSFFFSTLVAEDHCGNTA